MFRIDRAPRAQMGGLHINCARIKITFFGILRSKAVSCQQIHWTGALPFLSVSAMVNGQQRTLYQEHIQTLDLYFRKFCPSIAGPPQHIVWTMKWCRFFTLGKNKGHVVDIFFWIGHGLLWLGKHHLQQAPKAFFVHRWILQDHQIWNATRLDKYFHKVITTAACFAAGHRAIGDRDRVLQEAMPTNCCPCWYCDGRLGVIQLLGTQRM